MVKQRLLNHDANFILAQALDSDVLLSSLAVEEVVESSSASTGPAGNSSAFHVSVLNGFKHAVHL
jgi:hypothetical protein